MLKKLLFYCLIFSWGVVISQEKEHRMAIGFSYGVGSEFKNSDYTFTNRFVKGQWYCRLATTKHFQFELLVQPEVNFGTHQLLNLYFVTPEEPNYEERRERFTKLKDIHEYVLNVGFVARKPITKNFSIYALLSVGPMITDTETERQSKGFAFADVFGLGFSYKTRKVTFDLRPTVRHTSNAGLQSSNAGFNTMNIEAGLVFPL